jgi:hypothetical protein
LVIHPLERSRNAAELLVLLRYWNAASVAGLLLTTEVMIADAPQDEAENAQMPPGGCMGDMGMEATALTCSSIRYESPVRKLAGAFP